MPEQVRFTVDHHQLRLVVSMMQNYLGVAPRGELHSFLHSIIAQQCITLERKLLLRRLEYRLQMPVHFALAFRRVVSAGMELLPEAHRTEMRILMSVVDPATNRYL